MSGLCRVTYAGCAFFPLVLGSKDGCIPTFWFLLYSHVCFDDPFPSPQVKSASEPSACLLSVFKSFCSGSWEFTLGVDKLPLLDSKSFPGFRPARPEILQTTTGTLHCDAELVASLPYLRVLTCQWLVGSGILSEPVFQQAKMQY